MIKHKYKKYVLELRNELIRLLQSKKIILLDAPTGGGKTYALLDIFKKLATDTTQMYILATPNRSQSSQNAKYSVTAIVGGVEIATLSDKELTTVSAVYDKIDALISEAEIRKMKTTLIVDEAHELVYSYGHRRDAVHKVMDCVSKAETVIYMSATSKVLEHNKDLFKIEEIVHLEQLDRKPNAQQLSIINYDNINSSALLLNTIIQNSKHFKQIFVRHNDKAVNVSIVNQLNKKNITATCIDSTTKEESDIYQKIISDGIIDNKYQVIIVTSIMDSGVSILNSNDTLCIYACKPNECNLSSIIQFSNRFRNQYSKFILLKNKYISYNKIPVDDREKYSLEYFENTKKSLLASGMTLKEISGIIKSTMDVVSNSTTCRFVSYIELDENTGNITINEFLKALYIESLTFFTIANNKISLEKELTCISKNKSTTYIDDIESDKAFIDGVKESKAMMKEEKENQFMDISKVLSEILELNKAKTKDTCNKFARGIIQWLDDWYMSKSIKPHRDKLEEMREYIETNINPSILADYMETINKMCTIYGKDEYIILTKCSEITEKADLTRLVNQLNFINFNFNYNRSDDKYIRKYAKDFYDLFLIRKVLDTKVQKQKLSDALLSQLQADLHIYDDAGNIIKKYSKKKLKNRINLLYNISKDNKITSIKIHL